MRRMFRHIIKHGWAYAVAALAVGMAELFVVAELWWIDVDYQRASDIALLVMAANVVAFNVLYGVRSRWWDNLIGKVFFTKGVMLALVLVQVAVAIWWSGDYPGRQQIRFAIYSLGAASYVLMIVTLIQQQRRDRGDGGPRFDQHIPR